MSAYDRLERERDDAEAHIIELEADREAAFERIGAKDARIAKLEAAWDGLRREVVAYEKSGIDLYQRANGKAFRKMMDRWAKRG